MNIVQIYIYDHIPIPLMHLPVNRDEKSPNIQKEKQQQQQQQKHTRSELCINVSVDRFEDKMTKLFMISKIGDLHIAGECVCVDVDERFCHLLFFFLFRLTFRLTHFISFHSTPEFVFINEN